MVEQEFLSVNIENSQRVPELLGPSIEVIKDLRAKKIIVGGSPFWWSTDYTPDPREYVPFDEFQERLVHLGEAPTIIPHVGYDIKRRERNIDLYPYPNVPISILNIPVDGHILPFMITARPYHEKEIGFSPSPRILVESPTIEAVTEQIKSEKPIELPDHFYPHVRGLFAGRRGNHFFWYKLEPYSREDIEKGNFDAERFSKVKDGLRAIGFNSLGVSDHWFSDEVSYPGVWNEIMRRPDLFDVKSGPKWMDFTGQQVSAEELIAEHKLTPELVVHYPLRMPYFTPTLPLVITNSTNKGATNRNPAVLGILADNGLVGNRRKRGIFRLKDRDFAIDIAGTISQDFGIPVNSVLFTPQKGKPLYERVLGSQTKFTT